MRVTNSMMIGTVLRNLNSNLARMMKSGEQMASGKRINRPSDDPVGLAESMRLNTGLNELEQYTTNAEEAKSWLELTDSTLNEVIDVLQRVRELAVKGANSSIPQESRDAIASEIDQLKEHLIQAGNTLYGDSYIFSGTKTRTPAFDDSGNFQGNTNTIKYEIGVGVKVPVNIDGQQAFGNTFNILDTLATNIRNGDVPAVSGTDLSDLDDAIDNILSIRATIGARVNRLELAINRMEEQNTNMTSLLSKKEDVDMAELIVHLKVQENTYRASLNAGARIVQPSLLDFLR